MLIYCYAFESASETYYVYESSKVEAITEYLRANVLEELPDGITITRTNA